MIYADKNLAQKLERTEANANASIVETRARLSPKSGAEWMELAGTYAMFDGVSSPLTQTFGLSLFEKITDTELTKIEQFFEKHQAPVFHEVCPLADGSLLPLLNQRHYRPIELTNVMFLPLPASTKTNSLVKTRIIDAGEEIMWAKTAAKGWSTEGQELSDFILEMGTISAKSRNGFAFLGELANQPIATGMLFIFDDVAMLAGASTVFEARGQGAQSALLNARLQFAAKNGAKIAMMCAAPGSQSQRNAEKNDFRIAYTRTKWQRFLPNDN